MRNRWNLNSIDDGRLLTVTLEELSNGRSGRVVDVLDAVRCAAGGAFFDVGATDPKEWREDVAGVPASIVENEHEFAFCRRAIGDRAKRAQGPH